MLDASLPDSCAWNDDGKGCRTNTAAMHSSCSSEHKTTTRLAQKHSQRERNSKSVPTPRLRTVQLEALARRPAQCKKSYEHGKSLQKDSSACLHFALFTGILGAGFHELLRNFSHTRDDEHFHHIFIRRRIKARKISRLVIGSFVDVTTLCCLAQAKFSVFRDRPAGVGVHETVIIALRKTNR